MNRHMHAIAQRLASAMSGRLRVRLEDHCPGLPMMSVVFLRTTWTTAGVGDVDDRNDNPDQHDKDDLGGADRSGS